MISFIQGLRIKFDKGILDQGYKVYCILEDSEGYSVAGPLTMERTDEYANPYPSFEIGNEAMQEIMNQLWNFGFRPTEEVATVGQLSAMKEHITDLRYVVKKLFGERIDD